MLDKGKYTKKGIPWKLIQPHLSLNQVRSCQFRDEGEKKEESEDLSKIPASGYSAVRLAYLLWEQGVPGSNPGTPTLIIKHLQSKICKCFFVGYNKRTNKS
jgi:hypothetical protein